MRIGSVHIRNFRKLKNCHIEFAEKETVFVGANNSGKTSAISAIVWFIKNTEKFTLKEFSATNWAKINEIGEKWLKNPSEFDEKLLSGHLWDELVPSLDLWIELEDGEQYRVSHLIPSLTTWQGKTVGVRSQYQPKDTRKLLSAYEEAKEKAKKLESSEEWEKASRPKLFPQDLCDFLRKGSNLKDFFEVKYFVIDAEKEIDDDPGAQATPDDALDSNPFTELIRVDAILASRDFSDPEGQTDNDIDTLSKQFQQYYKASRKADEDLTVNDLELLAGVFNANRTYDQQITKAFEAPVEELRNINYPGFQNPSITLSSKIQIEEVMKHESAVQFSIHGQKDLVLPEKYNGLGYRNLISIYLKLLEFRERWSAQKNDDEAIEPIHLVFIEEPEAHLHAQAQQVFVKKAFEVLCNNKILKENPWLKTQLVLSTHSNHVVNGLDLNCMRYFNRQLNDENLPVSQVANLSKTFGTDEETKRFVTRYIRLTHCDFFFADAVILVEGPAEKILVPNFLAKAGLGSYYVSVIEVNGRHAYRFRDLIERIGIATLIVADIDASRPGGKSVLIARGMGYVTGNWTIKNWLQSNDQIDTLLSMDAKDKVVKNVRIAFQTPVKVKWSDTEEESTEICPYTFEDALVFTNLGLFRQNGLSKKGAATTIANVLKRCKSAEEFQKEIYDKLKNSYGFSKADFAISLLYEECFSDLKAPAYIQEGLEWLKSYLDSDGSQK